MKKLSSLLILIVITFTSCKEYVEINFGEEQLAENQALFQVEFDNQIYTADYVEASIVDGVTILKARKTSTKEFIVISLNNDVVGTNTLSPNDDIGTIRYKKDEDDTFSTSATAYSGRIDLTEINYTKMKLFGTFSFIGTRSIPLLDNLGNPVLDTDNNPVYTDEIKNFTNGLFNNIEFSATEAVDTSLTTDEEPESNTFYMKVDGVEFVETTLSAEKIMVGGVEVIKIKATNDGSNHQFHLQMPADVILGSSHILNTTTATPASESISTYRIISLSEEFGAYSGGDIAVPLLSIISHDTNTNKLVATFEYSGEHGILTKQFTEGAFSVTYTE